MNVVFAGPSVYGLEVDWSGIERRAPARQGDLVSAVRQGARQIGLIDGYFGWTAATWHKEILFALEAGVNVFGSSSMGALRAAECASFGMVAVGRIANMYLDGSLEDDGDLALLFYPEEAGYAPYTIALVDALASVDAMFTAGVISADEAHILVSVARHMNFRDRTLDAWMDKALTGNQAKQMSDLYERHAVSWKMQDASELIERIRTNSTVRHRSLEWTMSRSFTLAGLDLD